MQFEGKVVAVSGAASGMGLATAKLLASKGAMLSLADVNEEALNTAAGLLERGGSHLVTTIDVRDASAVGSWIDRTITKYGKLDGVVNMAGIITTSSPVVDTTDEDWNRTFDINVKGVFNCLRAQLKVMGNGGSIVCVASVFGQVGAPGNSAYCASKAAVIGLARTAAKENEFIRVNCVSPGSVETPMSAGEDQGDVAERLSHTAQKRRAQPIEVARVVAFLLSEEASFVTGAVYNVDGGWVC